MSATTTGAELIAAERARQIEAEGWTPEHDAGHAEGDLTSAAICYATREINRNYVDWQHTLPLGWPWRREDWKPTPDDRIRELTKAGALIAAEIDRLQAQGVAS